MSREIKFRGWDKTKELMLYNVQNAYDTLSTAMITDSLGSDIEYEESCFGDYLDDERYVVMQYIGLKDKNGVEVYEGDIVSCSRGCPHEIIFKLEHGGNMIGGMPTFYLSGLNEGYQWMDVEEIIGNIYENPELLNNL